MFTLGVFGGVLLLSIVVHGLFLHAGAKRAGMRRPAFWRSLMVFTCVFVISFAGLGAYYSLGNTTDEMSSNLIVLGTIAVDVIVLIGLIMFWHRGGWGQALKAWGISLIGSAIMGAFVFLLMNPYILAAYVVPTNSMSPNVRGYWAPGICAECGGTLVVGFPDPTLFGRSEAPDESPSVCERCYAFARVQRPTEVPHPGDRIFCNRLKTPKRWDVVCYRHSTGKGEELYVKRLVGLPGEEIVIRDGSAWANGERLQPPGMIRPVRYEAVKHGFAFNQEHKVWGDEPFRLGADEYFLLGDNTNASADGRSYGPTKSDKIEGVVEVIYAPFDRMRILP